MYNKADIRPLATCSTSGGYKRNDSLPVGDTDKRKQPEDDHCEKSSKKIKFKRAALTDQRHVENLERKDRFLDLFEKLVNKL